MEITNSSIYLSDASSTTSKESDNSTLSMTDFYTLISAQLQNQSMYDTVDNTEFISQMVQFSMLSQMEDLQNSVESTNTMSMLGKTVSIVETDTSGTEILTTGTVEKVTYDNGTPYLYVDGSYHEASSVLTICNTETEE